MVILQSKSEQARQVIIDCLQELPVDAILGLQSTDGRYEKSHLSKMFKQQHLVFVTWMMSEADAR